jgi:hypothetical protein
MKILTFTAALLLSINGFASHILGGQLWYEHISTSFNLATFKVHLDLYRDMSGISLGATQSVQVSTTIGGSPLSNSTQQLILAAPEYQLSNQSCGGSYTVMVNRYEGFITVDKNSSIKIFWEQCCRAPGITGLTSSAGQGFYIEAKINLENPNVRSFDNSIIPPQIGILRMSTGQINQIATTFTELDGDSVYATLKPAKTNSTTNVGYATGYTFTQPINTDSIYPFTLTSNFNGFTGKPNTNETSVVSFRVDNYVRDTVTNTPYRIGYITADLPITVQSSSITSQPISISTYNIGNNFGSLLVLSDPIYSNSLSQDISEFKLFQNSLPIANGISTVTSNVNSIGLIDSLSVHFDTNLISGVYSLHHKIGSDSTLLVGQCAQSTTDTIINVIIPFTSSQIVGNGNPYQSGYYKLSNPNNIDSVLWIVRNGTLSPSNDTSIITLPNDSVFATFNNLQCELKALRYGRGITDTISVVINPTGIGTSELKLSSLEIFPNPTNGIVSLNASVIGSYELLTLDGRILESGTAKKDYDLTTYPKGIYHLRLSNDEGTRVLKILRI